VTRPLAILGPTASGKSAVAMGVVAAVSSFRPSEIVSVDAMQIYRGMDIGTAKPSADERRRVPHHLIDLVDPSEEFTVARFQAEYRSVVADLDRRGIAPVLVGGTGLYVRAVVDGLEIPGEWPEIRSRLESEIEHLGTRVLYDRIAERDPVAASRIEPNNARRIVRALEVIEGSGRPFSSFGPGVDVYPSTDVFQVGLRWDREQLSRRIERRVHAMMAAGWLDEVAVLARRPLSRTATRALGYQELFDHLAGRTSLDDAIGSIVLRTRQYAVRQERWFRRDPRIVWFDLPGDGDSDGDDSMSDVTERISAQWLERP
jgi:tRNA dimethylallyltransferase